MAREQLVELTRTVQRLLPAGAAAAAASDALAQHGKTLRELGQKVAALKPVGEAVERLTGSTADRSGRAFLDLLGTIRQLRASMATSGLVGDLEALPDAGPWRSSVAGQHVYALADTLNGTGPGREKDVQQACQEGFTNDLRLVPLYVRSLEDRNAGLAELIARDVLPRLGRGVLPELLRDFDPQGKSADARRLQAICAIDRSAGAELCRKVLSNDRESSVPVRVKALECLPDVGDRDEAERVGLALCQDRNRDLRAAAAQALRSVTSDDELDQLLKLVAGPDDAAQLRALPLLITNHHPQTSFRLLKLLLDDVDRLVPARAETATAKGQDVYLRRLHWTCRLIEAIGKRIDDQQGSTAASLIPLARHAEPCIRRAVMRALGFLGLIHVKVTPTLTAALQDPDRRVVQAAEDALKEAQNQS